MSSGWIYIVSQHDEGVIFKVGKTSTCVQKRIAQWQTGNPHQLYPRVMVWVRNMDLAERYVHNMLQHDRKRGEWFACPPSHLALAFAKAMIRYECPNNINSILIYDAFQVAGSPVSGKFLWDKISTMKEELETEVEEAPEWRDDILQVYG